MSPSIAYLSSPEKFLDLDVRVDSDLDTAFYSMKPRGRQIFHLNLLREIKSFFNSVQSKKEDRPEYLVLCSGTEGIFNYGGDLDLFSKSIVAENKESLLEYGYACIDVLYNNYVALNLPLTTISLVQGDALGGGFEAALSSQVIVAEKGVNMGLPEILFNLFPGMGAYHLIADKINSSVAKKMILSGKLYTSEELYEIGIVDVLAEKGMGEIAVAEYIERAKRSRNGRLGLDKVMLDSCSFNYESLEKSIHTWVDCAMNLNARDLKMMSRLVKRQQVKAEKEPASQASVKNSDGYSASVA